MIAKITTALLLICGLAACPLYGQSTDALRDSVHRLANEFQYEDAQSEILKFIRENNGHSEIYLAYITLAHTYKRVFDYYLSREALEDAARLAKRSQNPTLADLQIRYELSLIEFDTQYYDTARKMMDSFSSEDRRILGSEAESNITMQEGFLFYLDESYYKAESKYNRAESIKRENDPCNLPMILGKKLMLFGAMGRVSELVPTFEYSNAISDSCGILKYKLYAHEMLVQTYDKIGLLEEAAEIRKEKFRLREEYAAKQHRQVLRDQANMHAKAQAKLATENQTVKLRFYFIIGLAVAGTLLVIILRLLQSLGRIKLREKESLRINQEMAEAIKSNSQQSEIQTKATTTVTASKQPEKQQVNGTSDHNKHPKGLPIEQLTKRQSEIARMILEGKTNREISEQLFISENTVKYHTKNIYQTLDLRNRKDFLLYAQGLSPN